MKVWLVDPPSFREIDFPEGEIGQLIRVPVMEFNPVWDLNAAESDPCPQPTEIWELFGTIRQSAESSTPLRDAKLLVACYAPRGRAPQFATVWLGREIDLEKAMPEIRDLMFRRAEASMPF